MFDLRDLMEGGRHFCESFVPRRIAESLRDIGEFFMFVVFGSAEQLRQGILLIHRIGAGKVDRVYGPVH